jgi:hypothetical protein
MGLLLCTLVALPASLLAAEPIPAPGSKFAAAQDKVITQQDVTAEKVGDSIPVSAIGEPVSGVKLSAPQWTAGANGGYATVDGSILPVDTNSKPINFRVVLPAKWSRRGAQLGGGGMNGSIPMLNRNDLLARASRPTAAIRGIKWADSAAWEWADRVPVEVQGRRVVLREESDRAALRRADRVQRQRAVEYRRAVLAA